MEKDDIVEYLGVNYKISLLLNNNEAIIVNKDRKISQKVKIEHLELWKN